MAKLSQSTIDSVHQRLLNKARETGRPFNELLQYYAMEKFLLRMSKLSNANEFVLKGALLLRATGISDIVSIDLLDYIYAVLHSPSYREKYEEFLKNRLSTGSLSYRF